MRRVAVSLLVLTLFSACSGGADPSAGAGGRFRPNSRPSAGESRGPSPEQAVPLPRSLPPASMFIGSASHRTTPIKYCLQGACANLSPAHPPQLSGPAGSPVLFTLSAGPRAARLEVRASGESQPAVVALTPGPTLAWQATLIPGVYALTLVAMYAETEVSWLFELRVKGR